MTKKKKEKPVLFPILFPDQLKDWKEREKKEGRSGSQYEFAKQVGVPSYYVTDWKTGRQGIPYTYLDKICEVLGVTQDVYYPTTHDELYKFSSEYMTKKVGEEMSQFCDEIGLDLRFLDTIRELIGSDFGSMFPTWTPLRTNPDILSDQYYIRSPVSVWSDSAEMDEYIRFLQYEIEVEKDGETVKKLIPFTRQDLRFLKDVQTEVIDFIQFLFLKQSKNLKREAEEASERSRTIGKDGGITVGPLTAEELNQIDTYCFEYADGKKEGK